MYMSRGIVVAWQEIHARPSYLIFRICKPRRLCFFIVSLFFSLFRPYVKYTYEIFYGVIARGGRNTENAFYKERRRPFYYAHLRGSITEEEYRPRGAFRNLERHDLSQVICAPVHARNPVKICRRNLFASTMNSLAGAFLSSPWWLKDGTFNTR